MREDLVSIGALSKMVRLSTDTLRYYDEIDLLKPMHISQETGYRYYVPEQAATILRILELKEFGFSLKEIKDALKKDDTQLKEMYQLKLAEIVQQNLNNQKIIENLSYKVQEEKKMNKKVLIVDDASFMRSIVKEILGHRGFDVVEAKNGAEGLRLYKEEKPGAVILNVVMPTMDGIEMLKELEGDANVIMLTAMAQTATVAEALKNGVRDFIAKPFRSERLIEALNKSFTTTAVYNQKQLEKLYNYGKQNIDTLSQEEIDNMIQAVRNLDDDCDIITLINTVV